MKSIKSGMGWAPAPEFAGLLTESQINTGITSAYNQLPILTSNADPSLPAAYLNYLFFDQDMQFNDTNFGYERVSEVAKNGIEQLGESGIIVPETGYVYIYVSNQSNSLTRVYFDDLKVVHKKKKGVIQQDDYYPFGLSFNSWKRTGSLKNKLNTFQDQELIEDLDLGWVQFKWRNHMPEIGRFFNVDPLAEDYVYNSPYAFSENKVVNAIELEGLEAIIHIHSSYFTAQVKNNLSDGNGQEALRRTKVASEITTNDLNSEADKNYARKDWNGENAAHIIGADEMDRGIDVYGNDNELLMKIRPEVDAEGNETGGFILESVGGWTDDGESETATHVESINIDFLFGSGQGGKGGGVDGLSKILQALGCSALGSNYEVLDSVDVIYSDGTWWRVPKLTNTGTSGPPGGYSPTGARQLSEDEVKEKQENE